MADRYLTWYLAGSLEPGAGKGPAFVLDSDYEPLVVRLYAGAAPTGQPVFLDINDDGASIFDTRPHIATGAQQGGNAVITLGTRMLKGSLITLDVDQLGSQDAGKDLTVVLEMKARSA